MHRGVRESTGFTSQREGLFSDTAIWDMVFFGLDATIAADPRVGSPIGETGAWVVIIGPAPAWGFPRIRAFYTFDDQYVDLRWIELG